MTRLIAVVVLLASAPVLAESVEPQMVQLSDGSWRLTALGYQRLADELERLDRQAARFEAENAELRRALEASPPPATPTAVLLAGGLGLVLGAVAGGWLVMRVR
ncbi:MAG: hypothetical protein ACK4N5_09780 [Myxococcales bacterium]